MPMRTKALLEIQCLVVRAYALYLWDINAAQHWKIQ